MAEVVSNDGPKDPDFISYLLSDDLSDCYFLVGNKNLIEPERIGVVRKMLCAHSPVLRAELYESKNAEKGTVYVEDLYPDTFKHLLRFFYGYNNTKTLEFTEADNLLYAAEKYMVETLKGRLATRLAELLTCDNICTLLNNPACFRTLESKTEFTRMLQYETDKVLASPQFVNLTTDAFLKILELDEMSVPEIDLWRAALKWAKHHSNSNDPDALRKQLDKPLKHIRFCTLDFKTLWREVVPTGILTDEEVNTVTLFKADKEKLPDLVNISSELKCRKRTSLYKREEENYVEFKNHTKYYESKKCSIELLTKDLAFELSDLFLKGKECPWHRAPKGLEYDGHLTVTITRVTNYEDNTSTEDPITVREERPFTYGGWIGVTLEGYGNPISLLPHNKYILQVEASEGLAMFSGDVDLSKPYCQDGLTIYPQMITGGKSLVPTCLLGFYTMTHYNDRFNFLRN